MEMRREREESGENEEGKQDGEKDKREDRKGGQ